MRSSCDFPERVTHTTAPVETTSMSAGRALTPSDETHLIHLGAHSAWYMGTRLQRYYQHRV